MKQKRAIALQYEQQQDSAPRVIAKGVGDVAEKIIDIAKDASVSVVENEGLTSALMNVEVNSVIPEELFEVVAEVLAFVYRSR
jgi:flagellar biosynthesis protein